MILDRIWKSRLKLLFLSSESKSDIFFIKWNAILNENTVLDQVRIRCDGEDVDGRCDSNTENKHVKKILVQTLRNDWNHFVSQ